MSQGLQERISDTVRLRTKRPWYRQWWGRVGLVVGIFLILWFIAFAVQTFRYYQQYQAGGTPEGFNLNELRQDAKLDLLHNGDDPSVGPRTAPVTIVAFEDFECPYCLQAQPVLKRMLAKYAGDVRFIYKDFPLNSIHPNAQSAAEAGQCAHEQGKFWEFHDVLFANQSRYSEAYYRAAAKEAGLAISLFNECFASGRYKKSIAEDVELGSTLGVVGTPTFFINGELLPPGLAADELEQRFSAAIEYIRSL